MLKKPSDTGIDPKPKLYPEFKVQTWHLWVPIVLFVVGFFFMEWYALIFGCFCGLWFSALANGPKVRKYNKLMKDDGNDNSRD